MRLKKYIAGIFLLGILSGSCTGWLDIRPVDKITQEDLYSNELGFQRVLNGLYLGMASDNLYGENLSCGMAEVLGQGYLLLSASNPFYKIGTYAYEEPASKNRFEAVWELMYKQIADCNLLIDNLIQKKEFFSPDAYNLYLGEAYALHALFHFDLFRLFGPVCSDATMDKEAIPYYEVYSSGPLPILTSGEVIEKLLADVDKAIVLLKNDPILTQGIVKGDDFWNYRNARMNYYAAWALKAKICLHSGKREEASVIAEALISGKDPETGAAVNLLEIILPVKGGDNLNSDRVYLSEMLFYVQNLKRENMFKRLFSTDLNSDNILVVGSDYFGQLYSSTEQNDFRKKLWESQPNLGNVYTFLKYAPYTLSGNDPEPDRYKIHPILRLSELYLIAAECGNDDQKRNALETFRKMRGYQIDNTVGFDLNKLVEQEYLREFMGEGQYFFYLKRNNVSEIQAQAGLKYSLSGKYQIPLPESEVNNRYE